MYLLVSGIRYKNAPIEVRERLTFSNKELPAALKLLLTYPAIKEAVILNTCNRTEIYVVTDRTDVAVSSVLRFFSDYHQLDVAEIRKYLFSLMHEDTIRHIYRVAAGIDSMIVGEHQIVNQVKESFALAQASNTIDLVLEKLFKSALSVSKKVRTDTNIQTSIVDIPSGAIELVRSHYDNIKNKSIIILGSGEMALLTAEILKQKYECKNITLLCRDIDKVKAVDIEVLSIDNLKEALNTNEIVFVCTSAPHYIVTEPCISNNKSVVIVDISIPRNVNPEIANIDNVILYNTDDIQRVIDDASKEEEKQLAIADYIINEEANKFKHWMTNLDIIPTLKMIRSKIEDIRLDKLEKARAEKCPFSKEKCLMIDKLTKQLVNTILHNPTVKITSNKTKEEINHITNLLREMFDLDSDSYNELNNEE